MPTENSIVKFLYGTQNEYNELQTKDDNTFYILTDVKKVYLGEDLYTGAGEIDLSDYATKEYVGEAIQSNIPEYTQATQSMAGLLSAADKTKLNLIPSNAVYTDTTYSEATQNSPGLLSISDKIKLNSIPANAVYTDTTYNQATQSLSGLLSASDKIKIDSIPSNAVYTDTTYSKATALSDGLMSKQHYTKLEDKVLTKTNLTICTETEYNNMETYSSSLYLVIIGTQGNQSFQLMDSLGNVISPEGSSAPSSLNNVLQWSSPLSIQPEKIVTYTDEKTEQEWNNQ